MILRSNLAAPRRSHIWLACACILGLAASSGCGSRSGRTYAMGEVSGTVKYKGQPISEGKITFISTGAEGDSGTGAIIDGEYAVPNAPAGMCRIEIHIQTNENLYAINPQQMKMMKSQMAKMKAQGMQVPDEQELKSAKKSTIDLPAKYKSAKTSGLELDVKTGKQTKDWDLQ
jgi:hypothetical protein